LIVLNTNYQLIERSPSIDEYRNLCLSVGWVGMNFDVAEKAVSNSIYSIVAVYEDEIIGMARIVGDGQMYFYIQDVVVTPRHQGKGIGKLIMKQLLTFLNQNAPTPAFIGLFATNSGLSLYEQFGFKKPEDMMGMFRLTPIEKFKDEK
jgi:GNAT superfamily N-acetyltransferase